MTTWTAKNFVGGHISLDFVNTAGGRTKDRDAERLPHYPDAVGWARAAGVVDQAEAGRLLGSPGPGGPDAVARLRAQREALHAYLLAGIDGVEAPPEARARVEADLRAAHAAARLSPDPAGPDVWSIPLTSAGLEVIGLRLGLATSALLIGTDRRNIRICGACSWMYLDPSPSKRRRWCSMAACGNRTKVRRHADRSRGTA
ncbi:CGNR zinc finger domain-containing protein [Pseudonocardia eucalypti]|uniref:CGNR zinc finger domain-containing protein n=1 Tax=Pseudonocardia eucalypti TaxID=648755 RepID=A0ABP9PSC4_9PSEU|nr:putative RNA-binding Zn ribbon-like protein [Pseudonocardia eucalypti]